MNEGPRPAASGETRATGKAPVTGRMSRDPNDCQRTFAGTICKGMEVVDAQDKLIGHVDAVEDGQIKLTRADETGRYEFVPFSLIDGVTDTRVLLAGRGDASFGLGAQP